MKKLISVLLVLLLLLTACASQETMKTEAELKEEIRKELEAEANGSLKPVDESQEPDSLDTTQVSAEIKDKEALLGLIYENYDVPAPRDYLKENMETEYVDFTGDGKDDVICFLRDVTQGFYEVAFITADSGSLELLPFEGDQAQPVSHFAYYDGKFIQYTFEHDGYGMGGTKKKLYIFDGKKIKDTNGMIDIEFGSAQPPSSSYPNGYEIESINEITFDKAKNDYTSFVHDAVITGSEEYQIKQRYIFNENELQFDIETLIDTSNK